MSEPTPPGGLAADAAPQPAAAEGQAPGPVGVDAASTLANPVAEPSVATVAEPAGAGGMPPTVAPEVLARLVQAWHNRQPLARRLQRVEVQSVGLVRLHFEAGKSADAPGAALFTEPALVPGVSQRQLEALARRHGFVERPGEPDWPVREATLLAVAPATAVVRYLITAAIPAASAGQSPLRVLIGRSRSGRWGRSLTPLRGQRALARPRVLAGLGVGVLLAALLAGGGWWAQGRAARAPLKAVQAAQAAAQAASAASAALAAAQAASAAAAAEQAASAAQAASEAASAAEEGASEPAAETDVEPEAAGSAPGHEAGSGTGAKSSPATTAGRPASHPGGWALVSPVYARPSALAAHQKRLRALVEGFDPPLQVEVMHTPQGPVLTLWPLPDEAASRQLAEQLGERGLALTPMAF